MALGAAGSERLNHGAVYQDAAGASEHVDIHPDAIIVIGEAVEDSFKAGVATDGDADAATADDLGPGGDDLATAGERWGRGCHATDVVDFSIGYFRGAWADADEAYQAGDDVTELVSSGKVELGETVARKNRCFDDDLALSVTTELFEERSVGGNVVVEEVALYGGLAGGLDLPAAPGVNDVLRGQDVDFKPSFAIRFGRSPYPVGAKTMIRHYVRGNGGACQGENVLGLWIVLDYLTGTQVLLWRDCGGENEFRRL